MIDKAIAWTITIGICLTMLVVPPRLLFCLLMLAVVGGCAVIAFR